MFGLYWKGDASVGTSFLLQSDDINDIKAHLNCNNITTLQKASGELSDTYSLLLLLLLLFLLL